jgi:hypothetical protein
MSRKSQPAPPSSRDQGPLVPLSTRPPTIRDEATLDQIGRRTRTRRPLRRGRPPAATHALDPFLAHEATDALLTHALSSLMELGMNAWPAIGTIRPLVDRPNLLPQLGITPGSRARSTLSPRVVAAGGDIQHSAHGGDRIHGLMRSHEPEDFGGIPVVS